MELYQLNWDWIYVFIIFSFALFVSSVSFDMIAHWENKKQSDARILILGSGVFALALLLLTSSSNQLVVLMGLVLVVMILSGLICTDNRFETSTKPWELYLIAISSLIAILVAICMATYTVRGKLKGNQPKIDVSAYGKMRKMGS